MPHDTKDIEPWMKGPYELIKHANGHYLDAEDTDRRLALIGFDNAIEVSIDSFIRLHPRLRNGIEITKKESEEALRNFHTKIEFLDKQNDRLCNGLRLPLEKVVWYHQLRNELYHHGNGMVPELHIIEGARDAAITVFNILFGIDISNDIEDHLVNKIAEPEAYYSISPNSRMKFLQVFIEFEDVIGRFINSHLSLPQDASKTLRSNWTAISEVDDRSDHEDELVFKAIDLRNALVHGKDKDIDPNNFIEFSIELLRLAQEFEDRT